jgi:short-subunit dehydrogenase
MAGFQPMPFMSVYGATKAFVVSFTEGLWAEYRGRGIRFLAVCPGPVETGFFEATGNAKLRSTIPTAMVMKPEPVVAGSLKALAAGQPVFIPGVSNRFAAQFPRLLPRRTVAAMMGRVMKR